MSQDFLPTRMEITKENVDELNAIVDARIAAAKKETEDQIAAKDKAYSDLEAKHKALEAGDQRAVESAARVVGPGGAVE